MIREHIDAVLARGREDPILATAGFEGLVTNRPQFYWTVYFNSGERRAERLTGLSSTATFTFITHSVGVTPTQAVEVDDRVVTQFLDYQLNVPGRICGRIRHESSTPLSLDRDVSPALWFIANAWSFTSDPS